MAICAVFDFCCRSKDKCNKISALPAMFPIYHLKKIYTNPSGKQPFLCLALRVYCISSNLKFLFQHSIGRRTQTFFTSPQGITDAFFNE